MRSGPFGFSLILWRSRLRCPLSTLFFVLTRRRQNLKPPFHVITFFQSFKKVNLLLESEILIFLICHLRVHNFDVAMPTPNFMCI